MQEAVYFKLFCDPLDVQKDLNLVTIVFKVFICKKIAANDDMRKLTVCLQVTHGKSKEPSIQLLV